MPFDFPNTPATNSTVTGPGGIIYKWDGVKWISSTSPGGFVSSVYGRTGAVVAMTGDYTAAQVTNAVNSTLTYTDPAWISALSWSKITGAPSFLADPTAVKGDLIVRGASAPATRFGVGTDGQVLTADSTQALGVSWTTQVKWSRIFLSTSDILNLATTPKVLLPAPGAGLANVVMFIVFQMNASATPFTGGGAAIDLYDDSGITLNTHSIPPSLVTTTGGPKTVNWQTPSLDGYQPMVNSKITLKMTPATPFTGGTGTAYVSLLYIVT